MNDTQSVQESKPASQQVERSPQHRRNRIRFRKIFGPGITITVIFLCVLLTAVGFSAGGGVLAGQNERNARATQTLVASFDEQFNLGLLNLQQGEYELAAQRFRWIIQFNPDYPNAAEWLAEAERLMNEAALATYGPTIAPSTSDDPNVLLEEAKEFMDDGQWKNAITRLNEIQAIDPNFHSVEVKELLWESYKTLGLSYIRGNRIEEGLFLLDLAAEIKPLDDQTEGERRWATLYSTGKSYWGMNWPVVISNLEIVYQIVPDYRDVASLLWEAHIKFGDELLANGAYCDAADHYKSALDIKYDGAVNSKYENIDQSCEGANVTATPPDAGTDGVVFVTITPTPTP